MINRKLKSLRVEHGDTQTSLAEYLGIGINTFNWKENGRTQFTLEEAYKIAKKYNVTIEEIFFTQLDVNMTTNST